MFLERLLLDSWFLYTMWVKTYYMIRNSEFKCNQYKGGKCTDFYYSIHNISEACSTTENVIESNKEKKSSSLIICIQSSVHICRIPQICQILLHHRGPQLLVHAPIPDKFGCFAKCILKQKEEHSDMQISRIS